MAVRKLIVNADDFGFTTDVNAGIIEAHQRGILTATTLMATGSAFDHAVELARRHPGLDVGCHLVLVAAKSVAYPDRGLPETPRRLAWELATRRDRKWLEQEMEAQVEKLLAAGIQPSHLDTHKHAHLLPAVLEAICRVAGRFGIRWVRRPFDLPLTASVPLSKRAVSAAIRSLRPRFDRTIARHGCRTTDHFAGLQLTGSLGAAEIAAVIRRLPEGVTEFMCHPGHCTAELLQAPTRLKESRRVELEALTSAEVRRALDESQVELASFRSLSCQ